MSNQDDRVKEKELTMETKKLWMRAWAWFMIMLLALPPKISAQQSCNGSFFKPETLEQILAPIALHPDPLISQILMASIYPLEVVQADRWAQQNKSLKGD